MHLEFKESSPDIVSGNVIRKLKTYKSVIVFGGGDSGSWAVHLLRQNGILPVCYCDNSPRKWGKTKDGLLIERFEDALKEYEKAAIVIASMWKEEIYHQICKYDSSLSSHIYDILTSMAWETSDKSYESKEIDYIQKNLTAFEKLYDELADWESKRTLQGVLNYRLTRDKKFLENIKSNESTYLDKTILSSAMLCGIADREIIDGGAFDGDTAEFFINTIGTDKKTALKIHCYEADKTNCSIMEKKIEEGKYMPHEVFLHKAALWDKNGEITFDGKGLSGHVDENAGEKVCTESIDYYKYENVGLIKLDIEGAERKALKGAEETIKRCQPVLAVCAYHLQDDLLVLTDYIKSLGLGYSLKLRHYMLSSGDTILYGIPEKSGEKRTSIL